MDDIEIVDITLSIEKIGLEEYNSKDNFSDLIVRIKRKDLGFEEDFVASLLTFDYAGNLSAQIEDFPADLGSCFYYMPNMILIESLEKKLVSRVVHQLIEEGDFFMAFRKLL